MSICQICGMEVAEGERPHSHVPDVFMTVANRHVLLIRNREFDSHTTTEAVNIIIPDRWAGWVLDTCGISSQPGVYRLPGRVWEWCLARMRKDECAASFLEQNINKYLQKGWV